MSAAEDFLYSYLKDLSLTRFSKHCPLVQFTADEVEEYNVSSKLGDEFSMIMLWGEAGTLIFKTHYTDAVGRTLAAKAMNIDERQVTTETIRAYMNEFNNLMGGHFRGTLETKNTLLGMSLPFSSRGEDEIEFFKLRDKQFSVKRWTLRGEPQLNLVFSCEMRLDEPQQIETLRSVLNEALEADRGADNSGDIEFL